MPMYEYQCDKCGSRFEELGPHDAPPPKCPWCGCRDTRRMVSTATSMYGAKERSRRMHKGGFKRG